MNVLHDDFVNVLLDRVLLLTFTDYGPGGGSHVQSILNKWCRDQRVVFRNLLTSKITAGCKVHVLPEHMEFEAVLNMDPDSASVAQMLGELDLAGAIYRRGVVRVRILERPTIWERLSDDA